MKSLKFLITCLLCASMVACGNTAGKETTTTKAESITTTTPEITTTTASDTTTSAVTEHTKIDGFGEWYLTEPDWNVDLTPKVSEEYQNYVVKTPGKYVKEVGNITITVNFFKETYQFGDVLQAQIFVINKGEPFRYSWYTNACHIYDNEKLIARYYPFLSIQATSANDATKYVDVSSHQTLVYEYAFLIDDAFAANEVLFFRYSGVVEIGNVSNNPYSIEIPLEIIPG